MHLRSNHSGTAGSRQNHERFFGKSGKLETGGLGECVQAALPSLHCLSVSLFSLSVSVSVELYTDLTPLHSCAFASLVSRLVMRT